MLECSSPAQQDLLSPLSLSGSIFTPVSGTRTSFQSSIVNHCDIDRPRMFLKTLASIFHVRRRLCIASVQSSKQRGLSFLQRP